MRCKKSPLITFAIFLMILSTSCQFSLPFSKPAPTSTPDAAAIATAQAFVETNKFVYGYTGNDKFGAMAIHQNGEQLIAMTETMNGKITKVTGAIWTQPDKGTFGVCLGGDGLPERAFIKDTILLFSNYTDKTVDIAAIAADGSVLIKRSVELDAGKLSDLKKAYQGSKFKLAKAVGESDDEEMTLKEILTIASLGIGVMACLTAIGLGPVVFACGSALISIAATAFPDNKYVQMLDMSTSTFGCVSSFIIKKFAFVLDCAQWTLQGINAYLENNKQQAEKQKTSIAEARAALKDPAKGTEIALKYATSTPVATQTPTSLPATKDPYGCDNPKLTPEEKAHCGVHSYDQVCDYKTTWKISPSSNRQSHKTDQIEIKRKYDENGNLIGSCNGIKTINKRIGANTFQYECKIPLPPNEDRFESWILRIIDTRTMIYQDKMSWVRRDDGEEYSTQDSTCTCTIIN